MDFGQYLQLWTVSAIVGSICNCRQYLDNSSSYEGQVCSSATPKGPTAFPPQSRFGETAAQGSEAAKGRWQAGRCASCWSDGLADANGARGGARCVSAAPAGGLTARMLGESLEFVLVNVCAIL